MQVPLVIPVQTMSAWRAVVIELTMDERNKFQRRLAAHTTTVPDVDESKIILLKADGTPSRQISNVITIHELDVAKWRRRLCEHLLGGHIGCPHPGCPCIYVHETNEDSCNL